jgi:heme oxygenase
MPPPVPHRRAALRAATSAVHARLDACFPAGLATAGDYRAYLLGMHALVRDAEDALAGAALSPGWRRWSDRHRSDRLRHDLDWHRLAPLAVSSGDPIDGDPAAAGLLYVIEGSTLGARLLLADAARLGHGAETGAAFLCHHAGDGSAQRWRGFVAALDLAGFDGPQDAAMFESAATTFQRAEDGFIRARMQTGEH